jgi:Ribosomal protein L10
MPSKAILSEKQAIVASLVERIKGAQTGVLVDYRGINVAQDTQLRRDLRAAGIEYSVIKNTLTRIALDQVGITGMDSALNGTTSFATSSADPIVPLRMLADFSGKMGDKFSIKAAYMEGKVLSEAEIAEMAKLENKSSLYAKVLGTMIAPITSLAVVLNQILDQKGGVPAAENAPAEAPAAE